MRLYDLMAEAFRAEGATDLFTLIGRGNMHFLMSMEAGGGRLVHVRHEAAAVGMADGWARSSGRVGVCAVTSGPGLTQAGTQLVAAARGRCPLVVFAGDSPGSNQDYVQRAFAGATECGFETVADPDSAVAVVHRAFFRARSEQRPVVLSVPTGLGEPSTERPAGSGRLVWPRQRLAPDPMRVREALAALRAASRPVLLCGRGTLGSGLRDDLVTLGERVGALLATTLPAKGLFYGEPFDAGLAGLFATDTALELFARADCVLGIGTSFDPYTIQKGRLFPDARFVQVDCAAPQPMGDGRMADVYVQGEASAVVAQLLEALEADGGRRSSGYRTGEVRGRLEKPSIDDEEFDLEPGTVDPRRIVERLDELLPPDIGVVSGSGHSFAFAAMHLHTPRWPSVYAHHFGAIGQGLPAAIGMAVALDRPVVLFIGDGSLMMYLAELETAARYNLPILVVVLNDAALGAEFHQLRSKGYDPGPAAYPSAEFAGVAQHLGCRGRTVRDQASLDESVADFLGTPGPCLLDVRVSRSVLSLPYRRTHFR